MNNHFVCEICSKITIFSTEERCGVGWSDWWSQASLLYAYRAGNHVLWEFKEWSSAGTFHHLMWKYSMPLLVLPKVIIIPQNKKGHIALCAKTTLEIKFTTLLITTPLRFDSPVRVWDLQASTEDEAMAFAVRVQDVVDRCVCWLWFVSLLNIVLCRYIYICMCVLVVLFVFCS